MVLHKNLDVRILENAISDRSWKTLSNYCLNDNS
jgi:hypothetical protein